MSDRKANRTVEDSLDLSFVEEAVERAGRGPESVVPILQAVQEHYGYLPEPALRRVCEISNIKPAAITGVATFYGRFRHRPAGRHALRLCDGTACHLKGTPAIEAETRRWLAIPEEEDTDPDRLFTVEKVQCVGCCMLAPVMQIDDVTYGHAGVRKTPTILRDFLRQAIDRDDGQRSRRSRLPVNGDAVGSVRICTDSVCQARGCGAVCNALDDAVSEMRLPVKVERIGCVLDCQKAPIVEIDVPGRSSAAYVNVSPDRVKELLLGHFRPSGLARLRSATSSLLARLACDGEAGPVERYPAWWRSTAATGESNGQVHVATEHYGLLDPTDLDAYLNYNGFEALRLALIESSPEQVIEQVRASGLRGRGGAGFPTAKKWAVVRQAPGETKYVIGNGDEGDPGAFMDRMLMESFPYRVIEGLTIAAYAVGAHEGFLYVRAEYPLAVERLEGAIRTCEERGLLGNNILGSGFDFHLRIKQGAGAFVCGEETALIASLQGRPGRPRRKPPFPAQSGLWEKPTLVNNVETCAVIPWVIRNGSQSLAALGTENSKGTKVFALAGKVVRGGLTEVPMGTTIRRIVEEIGGGIEGGRRLKAVLVGGPSGGCVPAWLADTPIDYEALREVGAMVGSGGLIVLDDSDCMVDVARYFLQFTEYEACGKCAVGRIGTHRMREILSRLCAGTAKKADLETLEQLAGHVSQGSLCGLCQTAPNPVITTLRHFREEYEAHVAGRCPAGRCADLITYRVGDACNGCTLCAQYCPADAIEPVPYGKHEIDNTCCTRCDVCRQVCPLKIIQVS